MFVVCFLLLFCFCKSVYRLIFFVLNSSRHIISAFSKLETPSGFYYLHVHRTSFISRWFVKLCLTKKVFLNVFKLSTKLAFIIQKIKKILTIFCQLLDFSRVVKTVLLYSRWVSWKLACQFSNSVITMKQEGHNGPQSLAWVEGNYAPDMINYNSYMI